MVEVSQTAELLSRARVGDEKAWSAIIATYEGRLRAYFRARVRDSATADDLTQEAFVAVWTSLPNFDMSRPLEPFLFTIAAHKLTDWLRKTGRRPALPLSQMGDSGSGLSSEGPTSPGRAVSSMARSRERRDTEEEALAEELRTLCSQWKNDSAWDRLACVELTVAAGWSNIETAQKLNLDEQTVANHKSYGLRCLREAIRKRGVVGRVAGLD